MIPAIIRTVGMLIVASWNLRGCFAGLAIGSSAPTMDKTEKTGNVQERVEPY